MKNFSANLLTFVLVGTLSVAEAQRYGSRLIEVLQTQLRHVGPIPGLETIDGFGNKAEEAKRLLKEKCTKNGGPTAFENARLAQQQFENCTQALLIDTQINVEVEETRKRGTAHEVFEKICRHLPDFIKCSRNPANYVGVCLGSQERENLAIINNQRSSINEFICRDQGNRFATFFDAGDQGCIPSKQTALDACVNRTAAILILPPNSALETPGLPFIGGIEECTAISSLQKCAVHVLNQCDDPIPAKFIDNVFTFAKKTISCKNSAAANCFHSFVLTMFAVIFLKFV